MPYQKNLKLKAIYTRNIFTFFIAVAALLAGISTASAQTTNASEQEVLKLMHDFLNSQKQSVSSQGYEMKREGDFNVSSQGDYFSVTSPALSVVFEDQSKLDIGIVAMNVAKADRPDFWKTTIAFPRPMIITDSKGNRVSTIDIGQQRFAGLWHAPSQQYLKFDGVLKDIEISSQRNNEKLLIRSFALKSDLQEQSSGLWSGPAEYKIENMRLTDNTGNQEMFKIDSIAITGYVDGYNLESGQQFQDKINARLASFVNKVDTDNASPQEIADFYSFLIDSAGSVVKGMRFDMAINGIEGTTKGNQESGIPPASFSLASLTYGMDMNGFDTDKSNIGMNFGFSGLNSESIPADLKRYVPSQMNFDVNFTNLPLKELIKQAGQTAASTNAGNQQAIAAQMQQMTPEILSASNTKVRIQDTSIGNNIYSAEIEGIINADAQAAHQATAEALVTIRGLDTMLNDLQQQAQNASSPEERAKISQAVQGLSMVKMFSQASPDDPQSRTVDLDLTQQGDVLINGTSLQNMMGGGRAPAGAQQGATTP